MLVLCMLSVWSLLAASIVHPQQQHSSTIDISSLVLEFLLSASLSSPSKPLTVLKPTSTTVYSLLQSFGESYKSLVQAGNTRYQYSVSILGINTRWHLRNVVCILIHSTGLDCIIDSLLHHDTLYLSLVHHGSTLYLSTPSSIVVPTTINTRWKHLNFLHRFVFASETWSLKHVINDSWIQGWPRRVDCWLAYYDLLLR